MKNKAAILLLISCSANAASFDCSKAHSNTEKTICNTPSLSKMDEILSSHYRKAKLATGNSPEFIKLTKENWRKRESCSSAQCLSEWYQQSMSLYDNIANADNSGKCLSAGVSVTMVGQLIRMTYPGAPNYESVENGDEPETFFTLKPDAPISCASDAPQFGSKNIMQLGLNSGEYTRYNTLVGSRVTVSGILIYSDTPHQHTPLMIDVKSITKSDTSAPETQPQTNQSVSVSLSQQSKPARGLNDNGAVLPLTPRALSRVDSLIDQRYVGKMMSCGENHEMSRNGCLAYAALGLARAYQITGFSYRASLIDAAQDHGAGYTMAGAGAYLTPFMIAVNSDDGAAFLVNNGIIKNSDILYFRSVFPLPN
ncbi:DUF4431 domain-containing protein [Rosenbergiella epipactidis]|uniref:DUF4431 domain-containing protein n=1 Tax=Rosenbergiella epipactidis TaxID=1544694 RepID=UPI001F4F01D0|nr:DUF4431 domain-containing protein [Rosenbergiella epipactidis]